ncbi:MAG: hypothetical protein Kow0068_02170 [Marinilabiliales bacterium]
MKTLIILLCIISLVFYSCNNNTTQQSNQQPIDEINDLLPTKLVMFDLFNFDKSDEVNTLEIPADFKSFTNKILNEIFNGKLKTYDPDADYYTFTPISIEDIKANLGEYCDTFQIMNNNSYDTVIKKGEFNPDEIKALFFKENWFYNKEKNIFKKEVTAYDIVRKFYREDDTNNENELMKKAVSLRFDDPAHPVKDKTQKDLVLLGKNILSAHLLNDEISNNFNHFDNKSFWNMLYEKIKNNSIKVTAVADSANTINYFDMLEKTPFCCDTIIVEDPATFDLISKVINWEPDWKNIVGYIFIEDWYYDPETYKIYKTVKGITPLMQPFSSNEANADNNIAIFTLWFNY